MAESALYRQLAHEIRRRVRQGEFQIGQQIPGEHALSRDYHMSVGTVKRAMMELVREGILQRKRGSGTFVADPDQTRTGTIALYSGRWFNPFDDEILFHVCAGIAEACRERGINLLFHSAEDLDRQSPAGYAEDLLKHQCDGILCVGGVRREIVRELVDRLPVVTVAAWPHGKLAPAIFADEPGAIALATRHLAARGRRRIALAADSEPGFSAGDAVAAAYRGALDEAGLPYDERLVSMRDRATPPQHRYPQDPPSRFWIDRRVLEGADALVAGSLSFGRNGYALAEELGRTIGDDLAVVCVMDSRWAESARPAVTTVNFLSERVGRTAVELLEEITRRPKGPELVRRIEPVLLVRESCGAQDRSAQTPAALTAP